jgi:hypothetical protein
MASRSTIQVWGQASPTSLPQTDTTRPAESHCAAEQHEPIGPGPGPGPEAARDQRRLCGTPTSDWLDPIGDSQPLFGKETQLRGVLGLILRLRNLDHARASQGTVTSPTFRAADDRTRV